MSKRLAVYPGSFDPLTFGHLDLIQRAAKLFDTIVVAVAYNSEKQGLFSPEERIAMIEECTSDLGNVQVERFSGLTVDLARDRKAIALIRGLRAVSDFEYELTMAATNRHLYPDCETISFMPSEAFMFISSRLVKEIAMLHGDVTQFVPPNVVAKLKAKFGESS